MISVRFQGKPFNITLSISVSVSISLSLSTSVIQINAPTSNAEEAEVEWFYEDLQYLLELTPKKDVLFIIGDWNAKVGSQEIHGVIWPWNTKRNRSKANRVLPGERTGCSRHPLPTTQEKIYTWTAGGQH